MDHTPSSIPHHHHPEIDDDHHHQCIFNHIHSTSFDEDELFGDTFHQTGVSLCSQGDSAHNFSSTLTGAGGNLFFNNISNQPVASAFTLSFDSSTIIPIMGETPYPTTKSKCLSLDRTRSTRNSRPRSKSRSSSEVVHHIMAERKRRQDLTQKFIALAATIPGLKKMDKATVLCEAINHVKRLQEKVRELENNVQEKRKRNNGRTMRKEKNNKRELCWRGRRAQEEEDVEFPEMEVKVTENQVLIRIQCEKRPDMMLHLTDILQHVHLSVLCCSSLAFGNSASSITIVAQMKEEYNMKVNDLLKYLRQHLFKSHDVR